MRNGSLAFMIYPNLKVVAFDVNYKSTFQRECVKCKNVFKTREEAETVAEEIKALLVCHEKGLENGK